MSGLGGDKAFCPETRAGYDAYNVFCVRGLVAFFGGVGGGGGGGDLKLSKHFRRDGGWGTGFAGEILCVERT